MYYTIQAANNKGADQTARMCRLLKTPTIMEIRSVDMDPPSTKIDAITLSLWKHFMYMYCSDHHVSLYHHVIQLCTLVYVPPTVFFFRRGGQNETVCYCKADDFTKLLVNFEIMITDVFFR